jgi:hypothetical protein
MILYCFISCVASSKRLPFISACQFYEAQHIVRQVLIDLLLKL